jgi:hypothetical protein
LDSFRDADHEENLVKYLYTRIKRSCMLISVLVLLATLAPGQSQTIQYTSDTQNYALTYDEQKLQGFDMSSIVWLSPWYDPDTAGPYYIIRSVTGQPQRPDKMITVPALELGTSHIETWNPQIFEARAQQNIRNAEHQLQTLKGLTLPTVLEPVRAYLLDGLQFSLKIAELRDKYIKTGDVESLHRALCQTCACDGKLESLLPSLQEATTFDARRERSFRDWPNAIWQCYKSNHSEYPVVSWRGFLTEFGITEENKDKAPE